MNHEIRPLNASDIPAALKLCRASGWNQLSEDWERLIEHEPGGCFCVEVDSELIATATTTCYGSDLAWIGMMLVHEQHRRQGIANALITTCVDYLRSRNIRCIKLDATPEGKLVYCKLGFRDEWSFHRWRREGTGNGSHHFLSRKRPPESDSSEGWNLELDRLAFGVERSQWLSRLAAHSRVRNLSQASGMIREGYLADYLGPVVASTPERAQQILHELLSTTRRTTFWDIPQPNSHATNFARSYNFEPVRNRTRMWTGQELVPCDLSLQYAISDPGTG